MVCKNYSFTNKIFKLFLSNAVSCSIEAREQKLSFAISLYIDNKNFSKETQARSAYFKEIPISTCVDAAFLQKRLPETAVVFVSYLKNVFNYAHCFVKLEVTTLYHRAVYRIYAVYRTCAGSGHVQVADMCR